MVKGELMGEPESEIPDLRVKDRGGGEVEGGCDDVAL